MPKKFKESYYKTVLGIVTDEDYRLINKFIFRVEENKHAQIDHIVFGEKYFYAIVSRYFNGNIKGKEEDKDFIFTNRKNKKFYTPNPYSKMNHLLSRLCLTSGLNPEMLIGIFLVNDDCKVEAQSTSKNIFICNRKNLKKLIKTFENSGVGKIKEEQLQNAVLSLDKLNRRK